VKLFLADNDKSDSTVIAENWRNIQIDYHSTFAALIAGSSSSLPVIREAVKGFDFFFVSLSRDFQFLPNSDLNRLRNSDTH
jgi:hypothetical protein